MKIRESVTHFRQELATSCGAGALACLLNMSEKQVRELVQTTKRGTSTAMVERGLKNLGLTIHCLDIDKDYRGLSWLLNLSCRWPLYLSCEFKDQGKRGRPAIRHHAVLAANGQFYDPAQTREHPIDSFEHSFNRGMKIKQMILIECELKDWRKNLEKYSL
jgi:hypothetical protein